MTFSTAVENTGKAIDAVGVATIVVGMVLAAGSAVHGAFGGGRDVYRTLRRRLGRSILLGLELLVAADIVRTVAPTPSLQSVAILAGILLIRTFLSFSLELEITGASAVAASHGRSELSRARAQTTDAERNRRFVAPGGRHPRGLTNVSPNGGTMRMP